jgi:hypothetical protein
MNHKATAGNTQFQKFQSLAKGLIKVPKPEVDKEIARARAQNKSRKNDARKIH